jgi:hypothetical protein
MITSTLDLRDSEREFIALMTRLSFGRIERIQIQNGEVVLHPAPAVIRDVKFACQEHDQTPKSSEFSLTREVSEFLCHIRAMKDGEIACLYVRHGVPFRMEVAEPVGGSRTND